MAEALYIVGWHEPGRGFEPRYRRGDEVRSYRAPLDWFRGQVHSGEMRERLRARVGELEMLAAIGMFDLLCQLSAAQAVSRRGWLLDAFGRPLTPQGVARAVASTDIRLTERLIGLLVEIGWLIRSEPEGCWSGEAHTLPRMESAHGVRTGGAPGPDECAPKTVTVTGNSNEKNGNGDGNGNGRGPSPVPDAKRADPAGPRLFGQKPADPPERDAGSGNPSGALLRDCLLFVSQGRVKQGERCFVRMLGALLEGSTPKNAGQWGAVFARLLALPGGGSPEPRIREVYAKALELHFQVEARRGSEDPIRSPPAVLWAWLQQRGWAVERPRADARRAAVR